MYTKKIVWNKCCKHIPRLILHQLTLYRYVRLGMIHITNSFAKGVMSVKMADKIESFFIILSVRAKF